MSEPTVEDLLIAWRKRTIRTGVYFRTAEEIMMRDRADRLIAERKAREPKVMSAEEMFQLWYRRPDTDYLDSPFRPEMLNLRTALLASVAATLKHKIMMLPNLAVSNRIIFEHIVNEICEVPHDTE